MDRARKDRQASFRPGAVSCASASFCVTVDGNGNAYTHTASTPFDTTPPSATLTAAAQKLAKTVTVIASCTDEACTATTSGSVRVPRVAANGAKTYRLKPVTSKLAKGRKVTIRHSLSVTARVAIKRALSAGKRVAVGATLVAADVAGNPRTLTRQVSLKR